MANKFTLQNYRAYHHVTNVHKVAANTIDTAKGEIVKINAGTFAVTVETVPSIGAILVTRPYPNYDIPLGRYTDHLQTPIATGVGELVGITLTAGDVVIKNDGTVVTL